jgi:hypothetical protein
MVTASAQYAGTRVSPIRHVFDWPKVLLYLSRTRGSGVVCWCVPPFPRLKRGQRGIAVIDERY